MYLRSLLSTFVSASHTAYAVNNTYCKIERIVVGF